MRILYNNLLRSSSNTATNQDANYPITNLDDDTLQTEFRATTNSSVISCELAEESTVSSFAFGNHNIDTLQITLTKADLSTVVTTYTSADLVYSSTDSVKIVYETAVATVTDIEFSITSVETLYIGGLSAGQYLQMPYFDVGPSVEKDTTASVSESRGGVMFPVPGTVQEVFSCNFGGVLITDFNAINAFTLLAKVDTSIYIDRWEDSILFPYLFCRLTKMPAWKKGSGGIVFNSLTLEFRECK